MKIVEFKAQHLFQMDFQSGQAYMRQFVKPSDAETLEHQTWSFSAMDGERVLCCAGVVPIWTGRGMAWSYLSADIRPQDFTAIHRAVMRFLNGCYLNRIEMTVDCEFEAGHRWARMLGFEMEAKRMRAYRPDGGDCSLYARVR